MASCPSAAIATCAGAELPFTLVWQSTEYVWSVRYQQESNAMQYTGIDVTAQSLRLFESMIALGAQSVLGFPSLNPP